MSYKSIVSTWVMASGLFISSFSQADYRLPCLYIYKFSQNINWPITKKEAGIVIGVYGISPIIPALDEFFKAKSRGSVKYIVKKIRTSQEANECDILFVTKERITSFEKFVTDLKGKSILIISEVPGLGRKGACINFLYGSGDELKVEINKSCLESRNLKISTEALKFGIEI
jgi:YfiR/HmsC-like